MSPATKTIHLAEGVSDSAEPLTTPIYETTTFVFESADEVRKYNEGKSQRFLYSRYANPTVTAVERKLAALEGTEAALLLSSGQAATTTALLALVGGGDEIVCSAAIYGGTLHLIADLFPKFGITARFVSIDEFANLDRIVTSKTKLVWFESPINPTLRCVDIAAVARVCRSRGITSVIDNTFASPINQQPISLGVDVVMHSATKYLNGHSDVTAGVLAGPQALIDQMLSARKLLGTILDPYPAYALGRGLKTLALRVERQNASALAVARFLDRGQAHGPGLLSRPRAASRPRDCPPPDERIRRHGLCGSRRWLRARGALLRSAERLQTRRESRRRGKPVQPSGPDITVGSYRRGSRARRRHAQHGQAFGGSRGSG